MHLAADPGLVQLARAAGYTVSELGPVHPPEPQVALITGPTAWSRLRAWRLAGRRGGVVVASREAPPEDRCRLEPVVLLRHADQAPASADAVVRAIGRLVGARPVGAIALPGGRFDPSTARFQPSWGPEVALTDLEARLLAYLAAHPDRAVDRDELQEQVWDHSRPVPTKAVDVAVGRLRKKVERDLAEPVTVLTVRGGGYRIGAVAAPAPSAADVRPLVGREGVVADLVERLGASRGAILLIGPPGVGKSRVAREVGARLSAAGAVVHAIDFDALPSAVDPSVAIATALDLDLPVGEDPLPSLFDPLGEAVLIVDHGEQREDVIPLVVRAAAGRCAVLIASQVAPPSVAAEIRVLPPLDDDAGAELLVDYAGGVLDLATAREVVPLVDGLPLALILASAQVALLGADALLPALARRLALLSPPGGGRHGSLQAAVAAAVERLDPADLAALRAVVVFRGPFRLTDALQVLGDDAAVTVSRLVARGVLARDGARYRVLHAIRDHVGAPEPAFVHRHAAWVLAEATGYAQRLGGFEAKDAFAALAALQSDLHAALDAALRQPDPVVATRLAGCIDELLRCTGNPSERQVLFDRVAPVARGTREAEARLAFHESMLIVNRDAARALELARFAVDALEGVDPMLAARATSVATHVLLDARPADALQMVLAIDPERVGERIRWRLRGTEVLCREALGELSPNQGMDALRVVVDQLVEQGALSDAAQLGLRLVSHLAQLAPHHVLPTLERLAAWCEALRDQRIGAHVKLALAGRYALAGRFDDADALFTEVDATFARVLPSARRDVLRARAMADLDRGSLESARVGFERVCAEARSLWRLQNQVEPTIRLAMLELDAGRLTVAGERADEAVSLAERLAHAHYVAHARLVRAVAAWVAGDPARSDADRRAIAPEHLTGWGPLTWTTVGEVLGLRLGRPDPRLESEVDRLIEASLAGDVDIVRQIIAAGRAGDVDALAALARPGGGAAADARMVARVWLAGHR